MADSQAAASHGVRCFLILAAAAVDPCLTKGDVACLAVIVNRFNKDVGGAWPGVNSIAADASIHRTSVIASIKRLSDCGYLTIERGGLGKSNRYLPNFKKRFAHKTGGADTTSSADATSSVEATSSADATELVAPTRLELVAPTLPEPTYRTNPKNIPSKCTHFAEFWDAYPRKVGSKAKAAKSWAAQKLDGIAERILADVQARVADDTQWRDAQFIPHPTTYLNGQRWNDQWRTASKRPSVNDRFSGSTYEGSPDHEIPESLRAFA